MSLFNELDVYHDSAERSAAMNMAIDEALLEQASRPLFRFYRWDHPALSFGYFGKFADVADHAPERDMVRRWTGGGIVFHGQDLTYSIVVPADDPIFRQSSTSIYAAIHNALRDGLDSIGTRAELAAVAAISGRRNQIISAVPESIRGFNKDACFTNPVRADVMMNGRKIAGAAQRRTRRGLLQQGSIQHVALAEDLAERFAKELSENCSGKKIDNRILTRAREITLQKYSAQSWLQKR